MDEIVAQWGIDVPKRKMFGGSAYFINRNMAFGIKTDEMIVKGEKETLDALLLEPGINYFEYGGRYMKSWLQADAVVLDDINLVRLLEISRDYILTLQPKK